MIKSFMVSFALMGVVALTVWGGVLDIFTSKAVLYAALALLVIVLAAAFIILGNPLNGLKDNDKKND